MGFFDRANGRLGVVHKGASLGMQNKWRSLSGGQKDQLRRTLPDSDRDGVPDRFDCQPFNPRKQDDTQTPEKPKQFRLEFVDNQGELDVEEKPYKEEPEEPVNLVNYVIERKGDTVVALSPKTPIRREYMREYDARRRGRER